MHKAGQEVTPDSLAAYARDHYYPRQIQNYFKGMDAVAWPKGVPVAPATVTAPQQLLDRQPDGPYELVDLVSTPREVLGRNSWLIWCGGNERFWDWLATDHLGFIDLLKLVDSSRRPTRFAEGGLINEPGMVQAAAPSADEFGLRVDVPADEEVRKWRAEYVEDAFGDAFQAWKAAQGQPLGGKPADSKTKQTKQGNYANPGSDSDYQSVTNNAAYEKGIPPPKIYGLSSGVVGLRLFPNPKFDAEEAKRWDPDRYYNDPAYYNDPKLVRPYRVGMSCAYCHVSFHPLNPPRDVANPQWANLSGSIGAQYLRVRTAFGNLLKPENFTYHVLDSQPPGTIDTSLIPSDNINNTNTMNSIWAVPARVVRSFELPQERLSTQSATRPSLWGNPDPAAGEPADPTSGPLDPRQDAVPAFWKEQFSNLGLKEKIGESNGNPRWVPRVLLDGADSVGAWVALARVYLNIGTYSEQWNMLHNPVVGFKKQRPFRIEDSRKNSVYWHATEMRVGPMRDYFLKITPPMPLLAARDHGTADVPDVAEFNRRVAADDARKAQAGANQASTALASPTAAPAVEAGREHVLSPEETEPERSPTLAQAVTDPPLHPRLKPIDNPALLQRVNEQKNTDFQTLLSTERARRIDVGQLAQGRRVFARNCIACHSSIQPESHIRPGVTAVPPAEKGKREEARLKLADARQKKFKEWADKGEFWDHNPGQWLSDPEYIKWAEEIVEAPDFWRNNFLSSDYRIPINLVRTNSARALATNALTNNLWEDFSSESFRRMPSVGAIDFFNPYPWNDDKQRARVFGKNFPSPFIKHGDGQFTFTPRHKVADGVPPGGGGPGFYRVPSLISIWATAPLLHNNSLGLFNNDPSVDGRLAAFDDAIRKLLWPEKRLQSSSYNGATAERLKADRGLIWRLPQSVSLEIPGKYAAALGSRLPARLAMQAGLGSWFSWLEWSPLKKVPWLPSLIFLVIAFILLLRARRTLVRWLGYVAVLLAIVVGLIAYVGTGNLGDVRIGPFPKGMPVNLIVNTNPDEDPKKVRKVVTYVLSKLGEIESKHLRDEDAERVLREEIAPAMLEISKCPDFVMDRGHYFDSMSDDDKNALIELLKTF